MLTPASRVRIYACVEAMDMRKSFAGLSGAVRGILKADPLSGHVFLFFNRRRNYLKLLWWDVNGYCIVAKRLVRGTFGAVTKEALTLGELQQVLEGVELQKIARREHYEYFPP
jgi:transposase